MKNEIEVTLENNVIPTEARNAILRAKTLGIISSDRSSIRAADILETAGGYTVKIDRQTAKVGEMTGSERREALTRLCKTQNVDVTLLARVVSTETGSMVATAFTGRAKLNQKWTMDVHSCKSGAFDSFGGALNMNVGIYNAKATAELEENIGAAIADKLLTGLGKAASNKSDAGQSSTSTVSPPTQVPTPVAAQQVIAASTSDQSRPSELRIVKSLTTIEIQQKLLALGYQIGIPDGVAGKRTTDALRKFQKDNGLVSSGIADEPTVQRLSQMR